MDEIVGKEVQEDARSFDGEKNFFKEACLGKVENYEANLRFRLGLTYPVMCSAGIGLGSYLLNKSSKHSQQQKS